MSAPEYRCEAAVRAGAVGMHTYYRTCGKPATHQKDGRWYCAEHAMRAATQKQTDAVRVEMQRAREDQR